MRMVCNGFIVCFYLLDLIVFFLVVFYLLSSIKKEFGYAQIAGDQIYDYLLSIR